MSPGLRLIPPGFALIGVTYGLARFAYGLFLPAMREDLAFTSSLAGLIGAGSFAGYCVAIVASALLVERLGPRNVAALAGAVAALGMAAIALAPSPLVLACAVLFAGSSTGLASPPLAEAVAARIPERGQGRANTLINSGTSVGVALSGPIALAFTSAWREAYWLFALLALGVTVWVWRALPPRAPSGGTGASGITVEALRRPGARPLMLAAFGTGASSAVYWAFARETMAEVGGLSAPLTSTAWVLIGLAGLIGGMAGDLVRRYGVSPVHRAALTALALAIAGVGLLPGAVVVAYASAALFGAAYIMLTGVYLVWGILVFADRPALGLGLPFLLIAVGQTVGSSLAGVAITVLGHAGAYVLFAALALATMLVRPRRTDL